MIKHQMRRYEEDTSGELWWCNSHQRFATYVFYWLDDNKEHCCKPGLGGIMIPCSCVNLTNELEITEE